MRAALPVVSVFVVGLLLVISFGADWSNLSAGGSVDLRNRITGARLLQSHRDAYHYKWKLPEPPEFCDPYNNLALPISKVTVTPTLLMLNFPLAALPYRPAQFIWLISQWLLLLGAGLIWMRLIPSFRLRWLWAAVVVGFTYTAAWRLHAERGQAYVVMIFLLACWMVVTIHPRFGNSLRGGLLAGLLVALRPPLLLLLWPFMLLRRRGQLVGAIIGLVLSAGPPLLWSSSCWSDYQSGMQTWSDLYRAGTANPRPPAQAFPAFVEDISIDVLGSFAQIPFADTSVFALFQSWEFYSVPVLPVALTLVALVALWFWLSKKQTQEVLLVGIAAWSFLVDLFLPAYRNSYNDILILNVVALGLLIRNRHPWTIWLLLAAWPVGWGIAWMTPYVKWIINLPTLIMVVASVLVLLRPAFDKASPKPDALT